MDIKGPLEISPSGNRHYAMVMDAFTKFVVLFPLENLEAATIWSAFYDHVICHLGVPVTLHTDAFSSLTRSL